ncbi:MAG: putative nucleotide-diphospho-sugar transferase [Candidatus Omnitrophota bacterium]
MKLYSFYTQSHRILKEEWFLNSLKDDYELIIEEYDQIVDRGDFMAEGWLKLMSKKIDLIMRAIKENDGEIFIVSDVDIQFFRPTKEAILKLIGNNDLLIQRDSPDGILCLGFFALRANSRTLALWQDISKLLGQDAHKHEQDILNDLMFTGANKICSLAHHITRITGKCFGINNQLLVITGPLIDNPYRVKWGYLPKEFFGGGTLTGKLWSPGMSLPIPKNIILHHANWTIGVENKIAQLKYVRGVVEKQC